ncbi:MAG: hypothetical protein WBB08_08815, partial [Halobacteriota archaeon]
GTSSQTFRKSLIKKFKQNGELGNYKKECGVLKNFIPQKYFEALMLKLSIRFICGECKTCKHENHIG